MKPCSISAGQLHRSIKKAPKCLIEQRYNEAWTDDIVSVELTAEEWVNILALLESTPNEHIKAEKLRRNTFQYLDRD